MRNKPLENVDEKTKENIKGENLILVTLTKE